MIRNNISNCVYVVLFRYAIVISCKWYLWYCRKYWSYREMRAM